MNMLHVFAEKLVVGGLTSFVLITVFGIITYLSSMKANKSATEVLKKFSPSGPFAFSLPGLPDWTAGALLLTCINNMVCVGNLVSGLVMGFGFAGFSGIMPELNAIFSPPLSNLILPSLWLATLICQCGWFYTLFGEENLQISRIFGWIAASLLAISAVVSYVGYGLCFSGLLLGIHAVLAILVSVYQEVVIGSQS